MFITTRGAWVVWALWALVGCAGPLELIEAPSIDHRPRSPYAQEIAADAPVGHFRLDGAEDGALEIELDGAWRFDGRTSRELVAPAFGGEAWTVELWARRIEGGTLIAMSGARDPVALALECGAAGVAIEIHGEVVLTGVQCPSGDVWRHLAVAWEGGAGRLSLTEGGVEVWGGEVARGGLEGGGRIVLGQRLGCGGGCLERGLTGELDEVALYDAAVPASRLLSHALVARGLRPATPAVGDQPLRVQLQSARSDLVRASAFSPEGELLALGSSGGVIEVRDTNTGRLVQALDLHTGEIVAVAFSPDGRRLMSASSDRTFKIWDVDTGALLHDLKHHTEPIKAMAVSPDGLWVATISEGTTVSIWDAAQGRLHQHLRLNASPRFVAFAPQSPARLLVHDGGRGVYLIDAESRALISGWPFQGGQLVAAAFSPDGQRLALASDDWIARVVRLDNGEVVQTLAAEAPEETADTMLLSLIADWSIAFSPDGALLAFAGSSPRAWIWQTDTGALHRRIDGPDALTALAFSPSSPPRIALSWRDGNADIHDLAVISEAAPVAMKVGSDVKPGALTFSPDGASIFSPADDLAGQLNDARSGAPLHTFDALAFSFRGEARFSPDGHHLVTTGGGVRLWDADVGRMTRLLDDTNALFASAAFSPDSRQIAFATPERPIQIAATADGHLQRALPDSSAVVPSFAFSADGQRLSALISARASVLTLSLGPVKVWSTETGDLIHTLEITASSREHITFSPDGERVAAISGAAVEVWSTASGQKLAALAVDGAQAEQLSFTPNGRALAVVVAGEVRLWDMSAPEASVRLSMGAAKIQKVVFNGDGSTLATISAEGLRGGGQVTLWDVGLGQQTTALSVGLGAVEDVAFAPNGYHLATIGGDRRVQLWDIFGAHLRTFEAREPIVALAFSPEGFRLATSTSTSLVHLFNLATDTQVSLLAQGDRWLIYTPDGFFDASPTGSTLAAMAQGRRAFGVDQLALTRNRPDVIIDRLGTPTLYDGDHAASLRRLQAHYLARARQRLRKADIDDRVARVSGLDFPTVRILSAGPGGQIGQFQMTLDLRDQRGLDSYQVYVNDVPLYREPRKIKGDRARIEEAFELSGGTNKVEVAAVNVRGVESPRSLTLAERAQAPRGALIFIGFGVSDYLHDDQINDLQYAHQDVLDLAEGFRAASASFDSVQLHTFTNAQVTPEAIERARGLLASASIHDTLVLFVAGHGVRDTDEDHTYYYLTHGARLDDLPGTAVRFEAIEALLYDSRPRKKLFLMDTCQSGEVDTSLDAPLAASTSGARGLKARAVPLKARTAKAFGAAVQAPLPDRWLGRDRLIYADLARRSGAIVFSSSRGLEYSLEGPQFENGAFTEELLNALHTPRADRDGDGSLSVDELRSYVSEAVPRITGDQQHPTVDRDNLALKFGFPIIARP